MGIIVNNKRKNNRKGIVIFVVLGTIFILGTLVFSYNYLVKGQFNETREILEHVHASNCAQAVHNYILSHFMSDIQNPNSDGLTKLQQIFGNSNDPSKLSNDLKEEWLKYIDCKSFFNKLVADTAPNKTKDCYVRFGFMDIRTLNDLKASRGASDILFLDSEKVGRLTIEVTVQIGHTREIWQETRPFKVVLPIPMPITKFNLYWRNGISGDAYDFNKSVIKSNGTVGSGRVPFILDNGSSIGSNREETVWLDRGWIYIGGAPIVLNHSNGSKNYGQLFYTCNSDKPITMTLSNASTLPQGFSFRTSYWGFTESHMNPDGPSNWRQIFKGEYDNRNGADNKPEFWQSSSLHLFSDSSIINSNSATPVPSITRVTGNVIDRFLELGYLFKNDTLIAAVKNCQTQGNYDYLKRPNLSMPQEDIEDLIDRWGEFGYKIIIERGLTYYKNFFLFKGDYKYSQHEDEWGIYDSLIQNNLAYNSSNSNRVSYKTVMSKFVGQTYDETYKTIVNYNSGSAIKLPPNVSAPALNDNTFEPSNVTFNGSGLNTGIMPEPDKVKKMNIPDLSEVEDKTLGLQLRKCYQVKSSEDFIKYFSFSDGLYLNNLVYEIKSDNDVNLAILNAKSPGAIYCNNSITVGNFPQTNNSDDSPLVILSKDGLIYLNNSNSNLIRAYLIAIGDNGSVKANNPNEKLLIKGGIALRQFDVNNLPQAGGCLEYNLNLDPTKEAFGKYVGIILGPRGGQL